MLAAFLAASTSLAAETASSIQSRQAILATSVRATMDLFPFGSGAGTFRSVYQLYEDHDRLEKPIVNHAHNDYVEIAFETGWNSMGTFGRVFRDVTGESPGELRAREKAAAHDLGRVPACYLGAAHRPDLRIAVSEKRRREACGRSGPERTEVP